MRTFVLLVALFVAACGPTINDGEIVDKGFREAYDSWENNYALCLYKDQKSNICYVYAQELVHHPRQCWFVLEKQIEWEMKRARHGVNCDQYDSYQIGDYVTFK